MKRANRYFKRTVIFGSLLFVALSAMSHNSYAVSTTVQKDSAVVKQSRMLVNLAGNTSTEIVVDVKVYNSYDAGRLLLVIENDHGEELFRKQIDQSSFSTRFRLQKADGIPEYRVVLKAAGRAVEQYNVTTTSKLVEDIAISRS